MTETAGTVAVIFQSSLTGDDPEGYALAADRMEALARTKPGFVDVSGGRGDDGLGITVSRWTDEATAVAWRDDPQHAAIREAGRERWYSSYEIEVCRVLRRYRWERP